ncbi:Smg-4/UPF3 family-domain-containing protein [Hygrophoropsis aurantiaca]|uniref:Smg-4/UPF3 family-domain-containing protein n=1 Tax=Hygrophoropsis aurantiaca TaxID=72124 RepID=A0ACB8AI68_9AGAM|nr:Smg-4/UPF3 family-domain-containing protein [Hygrophoropsis aurantiaca]
MSTVGEPKRTQPKYKLQKESKAQPSSNGSERLKTVVRRLPANLPEEIFWQSVQAWVTDDTVTWKMYYPGKQSKRLNKENIPSRAYIAFKEEEQLAMFSREYDGHLFRDKAGNESQAVVEFAPYQKIPTEKKKADARNATIEKDEDYISFLETLKASAKAEPVPLETLIAAAQPPPPPTTTPLLEALKAEKSAQKDKEAILRNHAHYKDSAGGSSKKEESKKKASQPPGQKQPELSKKAKKATAAAQKAAAQGPGSTTPATSGTSVPPPKSSGPANGPAPPKSPAPPRAPRSARQQPPKQPPVPAPQTVLTKPPQASPSLPSADSVPATPISAPAPPSAPAARRGRPVLGLGRHFEAALTGAGVERKKASREKETSTSSGNPGEAPPKQRDGPKPSRGGAVPPSAVPSILQRGTEAGSSGHTGVPGSPIIIQRPQSPRVFPPAAGSGELTGGEQPARGGVRRGRGGRGRGQRGS